MAAAKGNIVLQSVRQAVLKLAELQTTAAENISAGRTGRSPMFRGWQDDSDPPLFATVIDRRYSKR
jgi:hypothetical protein